MKLLKSGGLLSVLLALACLAFVFARGVTTEIAVGNVEGLVTHKEGAKLAANATVVLTATEPSDPDGRYETERRVVRTDKNGRFRVRNLPVGMYSVQATTRRAEQYADNVAVASAKTTTANLVLERIPMSFSLSSAQRVFLPSEEVQFNVGGVSDQRELRYTVYEVPMDEFRTAREVGAVLAGIIDRRTMRPLKPDTLRVVRTETLDITETDGEGGFQQELYVRGLPEGVYWLATSLTEGKVTEYRGAYFAVSQIGLIAKVGRNRGLVQVVDLKTGKARPNVPVRQVAGGLKDLGRTAADGTLAISTSGSFAGIFAQEGKSTAFVTTTLYAENPTTSRSVMYTDRPVYRPGDDVQWKGIIRIPQGSGYRVPQSVAVTATLEDPNGARTTSEVKIGPSGTISGQFATKADELGYYYLSLAGTVDGKEFRDSISVETVAYRKPEFKITVRPLRESYTQRDLIEMEVTCENYFGGPVVGAELTGMVLSSPGYYSEWGDFEGGYGGDYVADTDKVFTDDTGKAIIRFPASKLRAQNLDESSQFQDLDVEFQVSGNAGDDKYFSASGRVPVLQGQYGVSLTTDRYVAAPGESVSALVEVGTALSDKPVAGRPVTVEYGYYEWDKSRSRFVKEGEKTATTDAQGKATVAIPVPDANDVQLRVKVRDESGNTIGATASLWVTSERFADRPMGSLEVKLDQKQYERGGTASALIVTDTPGGDALLTVELDDIEFQRVIALEGKSTTVSLPIEAKYFPNATVSVVRVNGKRFQETSTEMTLTDESRDLKVSVEPVRAKVQPGETAEYRVSVKNSDGQGVATDLSLGVVDESVYAIREDQTDLKSAFYPRRSSRVYSYFSFPEVYLDGGEKDAASKMKKFGEIRKEFRDTAEFRANVRTDANGQALVKVKLPDNIGGWRATVVAVSDDTEIGIARANIVALKPLMVRLSLPTLLTEGDEAELSALVTNNTDDSQSVDLEVTEQGITLGGQKAQKLTVAAGETKIVKWTATAGPEGEAKVTAGVLAGALKDAVQLPLNIATRRVVNREYFGGMMEPGKSWEKSFDSNLRVVRLYSANSLLDMLRPSVDELGNFEYLCAEQTINKFVPALVVRQLTPNPDPTWSARVDQLAERGMRRLSGLQQGGGGFSWYDRGESDAGMTAIVLEGLALAGQTGHNVTLDLKATLDWADKVLLESKGTEFQGARGKELYWDPALLHLAAAVSQWDNQRKGPRTYVQRWRAANPRGTLAEELLAQTAAGTADVAGIEAMLAATKDIGSIDSDWTTDRVIGRALRFLGPRNPGGDQVQRLVGLAISRRQGASWVSTRDTAEMVLGLASLPNVSAAQSGQIEVMVDGQPVPLTDGQLVIKSRRTESIEVRNLGTAPAAYSLMVETLAAPGTAPKANPAGFSVARTFHPLEVVRMSDNSARLVASRNTRERYRSGEVVREVFTVKNDQPLSFVQITLPRVSGLEPADDPTADYWDMWYSGIQVFDDRITLFAHRLDKGEHKFELNYRAEKPGTYVVRPGWLAPMYQPDLTVQSPESRLQVVP